MDAVRYYVLHEMPFENDGNLTWELVAERTNSDLANTLGNLVNRTISMSNKYFGGVVENKNAQLTENDAAVDADLKQTVTGTYAKVVAKMEEPRSSVSSSAAINTSTRQSPGYWRRTKPRQTAWQPYCIIWWKASSSELPC